MSDREENERYNRQMEERDHASRAYAREPGFARMEASDIIDAIRDMIAAEQAREREHEHTWEVVGVQYPSEESKLVHPRYVAPDPVTLILIRCKECGWIMTVSLAGIWTKEQVRGIANAASYTQAD
jgi:hypothetical protein